MIIVYGSVPVIALVKGMIVYHHVSVRVVHRCMAVVQYPLYYIGLSNPSLGGKGFAFLNWWRGLGWLTQS